MRMRRFSTGQPVVYEELQRSTQNQNGAATASIVCRYMTVMESRDKGTLVLLMETGELHVTHNNNPSIRRASLWERLKNRGQFPRLRANKG